MSHAKAISRLDAFTYLWQQGEEAQLVIVSKEGWMVDTLIQSLHKHPLKDTKLFWLEGVSDIGVVNTSISMPLSLIAASFGEGFGLPLIEAASYGLPIIAREIPIFQEVANEHALFFPNTHDPLTLARSITIWLQRYRQNCHPSSAAIQSTSWHEASTQLLALLVTHFKRNE